MTAEYAFDIDRTLAALADPQRRRALELLQDGPMRSGELATVLRLDPPAMSRHLRVLRQSGLVQEEHPPSDARVRIYSLRPGPMLELRLWLEQMEEHWAGQLQSFKAHLEAGNEERGGPK